MTAGDLYLATVDPETGEITLLADNDVCAARWIIRAVGKRNRWSRNLCGAPAAATVGGVRMCDRHYQGALRWRREFADAEIKAAEKAATDERRHAERRAEMERQQREESARRNTATSWKADGPDIVYYFQRSSDGLIKIGTSRRFATRSADLIREHGQLRLLLSHRGDRARETAMHGKFAALRVTGEWFRPEADLLAWILEVRRRPVNASTALPRTVPLADVEALARQAGLVDVA